MPKSSRRRNNRTPTAPRERTAENESDMPADLVLRVLIESIIAKWSGTLEQCKEEALRNGPEGMYEAFFCEHNQYIAALTVLEAVDLPYMPTRNLIETERTRVIDMAKELLAVG